MPPTSAVNMAKPLGPAMGKFPAQNEGDKSLETIFTVSEGDSVGQGGVLHADRSVHNSLRLF